MNIESIAYDHSEDSFLCLIDNREFIVFVSEDNESISVTTIQGAPVESFTMEEEYEILRACRSAPKGWDKIEAGMEETQLAAE